MLAVAKDNQWRQCAIVWLQIDAVSIAAQTTSYNTRISSLSRLASRVSRTHSRRHRRRVSSRCVGLCPFIAGGSGHHRATDGPNKKDDDSIDPYHKLRYVSLF
jgi:hypothetical protein